MKAITLLFFMNMFSGMGYGIMAPLFPSLGQKFEMNEALIGWILSTFAFSNCMITPFIPSLCKYFTRIKILYFSTFCEATCTLLYGFLKFIPSIRVLLVIVFSIRIIHGICSAIICTLVYSITCSLANENEIEKAIGNIEVGLSMGTSLGPVFASVFYQIGGYPLPFIVLGSFLYISVYLTKMISKENIDSDKVEEDPAFFKLLTNIDILIIFISFIMGMICMTFYNPCLTYHLSNNYEMSISKASLFFIVPIISYFIILQFLNIISNKLGYHCSMSLGLFLISLGCYCTYPVPPMPKSLLSVIFGLMCIGLGGAPIYVPGLLALSKAVKEKANKIDEKTANDISSAMNNLSVSIGDLLGPILGGYFTTNFDFKYCCLFISMIILIFSIFFVFYFFDEIKSDLNSKFFGNNKNKNENSHDDIKLNHSFKNNKTGFNIIFQPIKKIKKRKLSFQKNNNIFLDNSLYSSLTQ